MSHNKLRTVKETYAAVCMDSEIKKKSSSGGAFAAIAQKYLMGGGIVCGAAICKKNNSVTVKHICIDNPDDLIKLQGSKYVQSDLRGVLKEIKRYLREGKEVLFSGTPCQVAGLYSYLGEEYDNLTTIDLICHGTPSSVWWEESLKLLSNKFRGTIVEISFRDSNEWMNGHVGHDGMVKRTLYNRSNVYYDLFLKGETFRESCYSCPFAREQRTSDITIGDFWGFGCEYNQTEIEEQYQVDLSHGLSCMIVNSDRGKKILKDIDVWLYKVDFEKVYKHNAQLRSPSKKGKNRELILKIYKLFGYRAVDLYCGTKIMVWKWMHRVKE